MHPPDAEKKNGPGGSSRSRQGQSNQKAAEDTHTVPRQRGPRHVTGQTDLLDLFAEPLLDQAARVVPRSRVAHADLWAPDAPPGRRTKWSLKFFCPLCRRHHDGRAESVEDARGWRRAGCGRMVKIRVRRVYDARPVEAVSA